MARPTVRPSTAGTKRIAGAKCCTEKFGYPAKSSSAPSPPSATVISRRAARQTSQEGNSDESGERLAQSLADGIKGIDEVGFAELDDLVAHSKVTRDGHRLERLVKAAIQPPVIHPDGERGQIGCRLSGNSGHEARVDASRQK